MEQKTRNQQHSKKFKRTPPTSDRDQPSKAPQQDEDGKEFIGSTRLDRHQVDASSDEQGISNRPVKEEHAFPKPDESVVPYGPDGVDKEPKQQGGNRGGV
jgi:hypothetical protein